MITIKCEIPGGPAGVAVELATHDTPGFVEMTYEAILAVEDSLCVAFGGKPVEFVEVEIDTDNYTVVGEVWVYDVGDDEAVEVLDSVEWVKAIF